MKAWIAKFLIYALIPLFFFIEGYADEPGTDILDRASQDMDVSTLHPSRERWSLKSLRWLNRYDGLLKGV